MELDHHRLHEALELLGAYLLERGAHHELVAIGGSALLLLGAIERPTQDLDIVAIVERAEYRSAHPLPKELVQAAELVAEHVGLDPRWLNAGPAEALMRGGLPRGFASRVVTRDYGGLTLHLASRQDQVFFKLHAAADRGDPRGKHAVDLMALSPTREELIAGARWAQTHDPSVGFRQVLLAMLADLGVPDADAHLSTGI